MSSTVMNPSRVRAPRTAGSALERAKLALVPTRTVRAPRAPFAVLVFLLLGSGVVGLLMFNTHMQQSSFYATSLQQRADALTAKRQALEMEVEQLRDPQRLAEAGRKLGMVMPAVPAFINLRDGSVTGIPTATTPEDAVRATPLPAPLPGPLKPRPIYVDAPSPVTPGTVTGAAAPKNSGQSQPADGPASAGGAIANGRND